MSVPVATANTPTITGAPGSYTLNYSWSGTNSPTSYTVVLYQVIQGVTTTAATLTATALTSSTYTNLVTGASYYFTVIATNGNGSSPMVQSSSVSFYNPFGGPQGVQGVQGIAGGQGAIGPVGPQGLQGLQGIVNFSGGGGNVANYVITTTTNPGTINANSNLTYDGSVFAVTGAGSHTLGPITFTNGAISNTTNITGTGTLTIGTVAASNTTAHNLGAVTFTNGAIAGASTISNSGILTTGGISTAGTVSASSTSAHTLGPVTFTNGAITGATSVANAAGTVTVTGAAAVNNNTLTVGAPTTATCNAIFTTGKISATSTSAHNLGLVTFTNGAVTGVSSVNNTTVGGVTISGNNVSTTGTVAASSTSAHTLGPVTFTNGAITAATSIANAAGTLTVTGAAAVNNNTLTVGAPTTATCNAIFTTGKISATSTSAHSLGVVTFTNGAIAGATTISNTGTITTGGISTTGTVAATSTFAHSLGAVTFTNGAIAGATTISNSGTLTTGSLETFGTIYASSTSAHTLGAVTFTNGAVAARSVRCLPAASPTTSVPLMTMQFPGAVDGAVGRLAFTNYNDGIQSAIDVTQNSGTNFLAAMSFKTNNGSGPVEALYLSSGQNVGINCNAPAYKLDVNGTVRGSNFLSRFYVASNVPTGYIGGLSVSNLVPAGVTAATIRSSCYTTGSGGASNGYVTNYACYDIFAVSTSAGVWTIVNMVVAGTAPAQFWNSNQFGAPYPQYALTYSNNTGVQQNFYICYHVTTPF